MKVLSEFLAEVNTALDEDDLTFRQLDTYLCFLVGAQHRLWRQAGEGLRRLRSGNHFMKFGSSCLKDYALEKLGMAAGVAYELAGLETWIQAYPAVEDAWSRGRISKSHVRLLKRANIPVDKDAFWAEEASRLSVRQLEIRLKEAPPESDQTHTPLESDKPLGVYLDLDVSPEVRSRWELACEIYHRLEGREAQPWEVLEACNAELTNGPAWVGDDKPWNFNPDHILEAWTAYRERRTARAEAIEDRAEAGFEKRAGGLPEGLPALHLADDADPYGIHASMRDGVGIENLLQSTVMRLLMLVHQHDMFRAEFASFKQYVREGLGLFKSTVDRWLWIQYRLDLSPAIEAAFISGRVNLTQAEQVLRVANDDTAEAWLEHARLVTTLLLKRNVEQALALRRDQPDVDVLPPVLPDVPDTFADSADVSTRASEASPTVGPGSDNVSTCASSAVEPGFDNISTCASAASPTVEPGFDNVSACASPASSAVEPGFDNVSACASSGVAPEPGPASNGETATHEDKDAPTCAPPGRRSVRVVDDPLFRLQATLGALRMWVPLDVMVYVVRSTWYRLKRATGSEMTLEECFELMVEAFLSEYAPVALDAAKAHPITERDHWACSVPGCSCRGTLEGHHSVFRSQGGGDEPGNRVTLCHSHHIHGVHEGYISVTGQAPNELTWRLGIRPDGTAEDTFHGQRRIG